MNRKLLVLYLGAIVAGSVLSSFAQTSSSQSPSSSASSQEQIPQTEQVERDASAVTVLSQVTDALGGNSTATGGTIHISGNAEVYAGKPADSTFAISFNPSENQSFAVTDNAGNTSSTAMSNHVLSMTRPGKAAAVLPFHKALNLPPYFFPALIFRALSDPSYSVINKGSTPMDGVDYITVELKRIYSATEDKYQELSQFTDRLLYIDPTTYEVRRIAYKSYSNSSITISSHRALDFNNYQQFGAFRFPSSITDSIDNRLISHFIVTQVSVN